MDSSADIEKLEESINKVIENGEKMLQEIRAGKDQKARVEAKAKGSSTSNIDLKYKALHTNVTNVGYLLRKSSDKKTSATDESEIMYELKAQMMKNLDVQNTRLKTELNLHERLNEVRLLQQDNLRLQNECTMSRANTHKLMKMFERKAIEANDKLAEMQKKLEKYEKCLKNHGISPDKQSTEKTADNHEIEDTQKNSNDLPNSQDVESTKNHSKDDQTKNTNDDNIQSVTDDNVENSIVHSVENLKVDNENDENCKSKQRPFTRGKSAAKKLAENGFTSKMDELARKNENMSHENGELRREIQRLKYDNTVLIRRMKFTTTNHSTLVNSLSTSESSRVNMVKKLKKEKQQNERLTRSLTRQTADWVQSRRLVQQMEEDYRWEQVGPIPTGGPQFRIPHLPTSKNIYMPRKGADTERSYTIST